MRNEFEREERCIGTTNDDEAPISLTRFKGNRNPLAQIPWRLRPASPGRGKEPVEKRGLSFRGIEIEPRGEAARQELAREVREKGLIKCSCRLFSNRFCKPGLDTAGEGLPGKENQMPGRRFPDYFDTSEGRAETKMAFWI